MSTLDQASGESLRLTPSNSIPDVSVVVCTRDRPDDLARLLPSILANDMPDYEVLVIDQSSSGVTERVIANIRDPRIRFVRVHTVGKARALNIAVRQARGTILLLTDDDCTVPPDWVRRNLQVFGMEPGAGIIFGTLNAIPHDPEKVFVPEFHPKEYGVLRSSMKRAIHIGVGANMAIRRAVFERIGGFSELAGPGSKFRSGDDWEFAFRALRHGYSIVQDPNSIVTHWGMRSYRRGDVRRLIANNYYGFGAGYALQWRRGDWIALLALIREIALVICSVVANIALLRRPIGFRRLWYEVLGMVDALRFTGDLPHTVSCSTTDGEWSSPVPMMVTSVAPGPDEPSPDVSVIVCTRNRPDDLSRLMPTILANEGRSMEVLIVDQSSDLASEAVVRQFPDERVRYIRLRTVGKSRALNVGIRQARAPVLIFTDDDCTVPPDWISQFDRIWSAQPEAGMIFGKLMAIPHDPRQVFIPEFHPKGYRVLQTPFVRATDMGVGANMAVRRWLLNRIGGFAELLGAGASYRSAEECDLAYRALKAGYVVVQDPNLCVTHWGARMYDTGAVRQLVSGSFVGIGAFYGMHVRSGDPLACLLLLREILLTLWDTIINMICARRPVGARRFLSLIEGALAGWQHPYRFVPVAPELVGCHPPAASRPER